MASTHTKHRPAEWRLFPATKTLAFYDSFAQYIELCEVESAALKDSIQKMQDEPLNALKPLPLLYHELRHWIDHMATVWGRQRLIAGFNAMNARESDNVAEFWRIVHYMRLTDRDTFGKYYRTVEQTVVPSGATPVWAFQFSCGKRFDADGRLDDRCPIFFTRFSWSNGEMACRVPFSVSALLETSAMHTEVGIEDVLVGSLDKAERMIEERARNHHRMSGLYNAELGVYSTAVHSIANRMNLHVSSHAYPLASALASLCLNLSDELFEHLRVPPEFEPWGELNQAALTSRDRGYAYLLLLYHADNRLVNKPIEWVEAACRQAGLPNLSKIGEAAQSQRHSLAGDVIDGPHRDRLDNLIEIGDSIAERVGVTFTVDSILNSLPEFVLPPILCADMEWHSFGPSTPRYDSAEIEEWVMKCISMERQFDEFMAACGH